MSIAVSDLARKRPEQTFAKQYGGGEKGSGRSRGGNIERGGIRGGGRSRGTGRIVEAGEMAAADVDGGRGGRRGGIRVGGGGGGQCVTRIFHRRKY